MRPKKTAFEAFEKECIELFIKEKEAVGILKKVMLPEQINQSEDRLRSNDLGHVVFQFSADEYRFHFFFLLQFIQKVMFTFIEQRKSDNDTQTTMEDAFLKQLKSVKSVEYFKNERMKYESILKDILGTNFELDNFEYDGVKVFSEKNMKFTDIKRLKTVVDILNTLKEKNGMIKLVSKLANVVCNTAQYEVTCNFVDFLAQYVCRKNLQRLREENGKNVEGSYEDGKKLADRQEICFSDEEYTRLIAGGRLNLAPTKQDIATPDGLHEAELTASSLTFESESLARFNLGLIRSAMKKDAQDVPPMLRINDTEISNPTVCAEKLDKIGMEVRNNGEAVRVENDDSSSDIAATLTTYVWKDKGIVAHYRTTSQRGEKLIAVKWIDKNSFLTKVNDECMMQPDAILKKFFELAGYCEGLTGGSRIENLGSSQELPQQVLDKIQKDLSSFRDETSTVHHGVKHGPREKMLPIQTMTKERFINGLKEYFENVKTFAKDCTLKDVVDSGFSSNGNYCVTIQRESRKIVASVSQEGILTLTTTY